MSSPNGRAPFVPKSQEELDQEAEDARLEAEERFQRGQKDAWALLRWTALVAAVAVVISAVVAPRHFAAGMAAGSVVMLLNLWGLKVLLARIVFGDPRKAIFAVILPLKFLALAVVSALIVRTWPEVALGFGIGLSIPAVSGIVYSVVSRKRS
ncbi:MAG: hypothetical protein AB2A00_34890 [Myxococcota bacterium]